jgi:hypothetical protein
MSELAEQSLPFFTILRGSSNVHMGLEQQTTFDDLNDHIQKLLTLSSLQTDQPFILYVSASHTTVSRALI